MNQRGDQPARTGAKHPRPLGPITALSPRDTLSKGQLRGLFSLILSGSPTHLAPGSGERASDRLPAASLPSPDPAPRRRWKIFLKCKCHLSPAEYSESLAGLTRPPCQPLQPPLLGSAPAPRQAGRDTLVLSYSVPSAWQALPALLGLAQSFFRSWLGCPFFQEASPEPLGGGTDSLWVSQCPGRPLTPAIHGGGSRAVVGDGRSSVDAGEGEHLPATRRPGQATRPQEERSKEQHPSRPPGHLPAPLFQPREISPSGTGWGRSRWGHAYTGLRDRGGWVSVVCPILTITDVALGLHLSPSERTSRADNPKGRGRHTDGKQARTQVQAPRVVLGHHFKVDVDRLGQ